MEGVSLITFVSIITFFLCVFFAFFLLNVKSKNRISNKLFAVFLILTALDISAWFDGLFLNKFSDFIIAKSILEYLQMPIFYLYVLSVCYLDFKLKIKHLLHTIPFIVTNIIFAIRFYTTNIDEKIILYKNFKNVWEYTFVHITLHSQAILYIIFIFIILKKYKKIYYQNFSDSSTKTYQWLFQFTLVSAITHGILIIKSVSKYIDSENTFQWVTLFVSILALTIISWYVYKALKHPELFNGVHSNTKVIPDKKNDKIGKKLEEIKQLTSYMKKEKPYLNPSLSIRNLSEEIKMNTRDLSILINQNLHQHFFDFINEYRINEAKEILSNPSKKELTILEILYEAGFNSKSSFNTAFKKHTGLTPTQFREIA